MKHEKGIAFNKDEVSLPDIKTVNKHLIEKPEPTKEVEQSLEFKSTLADKKAEEETKKKAEEDAALRISM